MISEPVTKIIPRFIDDLTTKKRSPATILAYRADLEQLSAFLAERQKAIPEAVTKEDIESFRDTLLNDKYTPKSVSRKLNAVKTFFRWLTAQKLLVSDPSRDVAHPKTESSLPKFLSQLEYRALRDVVKGDRRIAMIVELILQTGLRISEVASLKIKNINDNELVIESYATQGSRRIPLNKAVRSALDNYLKDLNKEAEYFFVSKNGKPLAIRNIRASIDRYMQRAEIPQYSVNDLRTTFVVENLKRGVDLTLISRVVGHKRLSTTERYLELVNVDMSNIDKKQELEEL